MGREWIFQTLSLCCARILALGGSPFTHVTKAKEGAAPRFFGPCTPHGTPGQVGRTWGTRPGRRASFFSLTALLGAREPYRIFNPSPFFEDLRAKRKRRYP